MSINQLYEQALFFNDWRRACNEAELRAMTTEGKSITGPFRAMEVRRVSYWYPGTKVPAVRDVSLSVRPGEVVALVGENGSGKSTLAKIMAGLYVAQAGSVYWNGIDIARANRHEMFQHIALLTQDFKHYPFTARSNITISDTRKSDDVNALKDAVSYADLECLFNSLAHGWDTVLDRTFRGGQELSGGQWQRIALARAHFRDADLVICDEPTSSLDPKSEIQAFEKLRALADSGKSVLLITHRLASARHAEQVVVLAKGRVVDIGAPEELLGRPGTFRDLYMMQAAEFGQADLPL